MSEKKIIAFILVIIAFSSCAGTMQKARTNGQGKFQVGIEPGIILIDDEGGPDGSDVKFTSFVGDFGYQPYLNLSLRYGVTDDLDMGIRLGAFNYELQAKLMLSDPNDMDALAISFAPSLITIIGLETMLPLRVLFGIPVGNDEIVFAPQITPYLSGNSDDPGLKIGGSLAYALTFKSVTILPEIKADFPLIESSLGGNRLPEFNIGIGILFGGR